MKDYKSKDASLQIVGNTIGNLELNPELAAKLEEFGFTTAMLTTGKSLLAIATDKSQKQKREVGAQHSATANCNELFDLADVRFKVIHKVTKIAIKEKGLMEQLGITTLESGSFDTWAQRRIDFYSNALLIQPIQDRLAKYNITPADLTAGKKLVEDAIVANRIQLKETGEARIATSERNDAFTNLQNWYSELRQLAKLALNKEECNIIGI
jgi:hypothetical protein